MRVGRARTTDLGGEVHDLDVGQGIVGDGLVHPAKRRAGRLSNLLYSTIRQLGLPFVFFDSGLEVLHGLKATTVLQRWILSLHDQYTSTHKKLRT
jgi:hypothetical protein